MDTFCGSPFWNSSVTWYTKSPDFTICFEKTILIWLPCIYLWIFSIFEAHRITKSQNKHIPWNWRNVSKVLVVSILFILTVCDSFYNGFTRENIYGVDIATPIIKLISFALVLTLILANRKRGLRTSGVQFFFWLLLVLCGLFQLRTEIKMLKNKLLHAYYTYLFYSIYYSLVLLIFLLSCINDLQPKGIVIYSKNISPEEDCCFISHLFFSWFETLAWKGFRNPLKDSDLYDLGPENSAKEVVLHFDEYVYKSVAKQKKSKVGQKKEKIALLPIILKALAPGFAFCISIKLICDLLSFAVPQILSLLINFVNKKEEYWKGYFYATLLFVTGTVRSLFLAQYSHRTNIMGLHIKTALNSFIYKKALKISSRARKNYTVGEIVNLISTDVKCVSDLPTNLTVILSAFMQVLIALYFLWNILGISVLAGLTVMLILIPVNSFITNKLKKLHFHRMEKVDYRIKLINEVLSSIKVLKLYAWEPYFQHNITDTRHNEIRLLKKTAYISSGTSFIWSCAPFLVSLVCFATFVLIDEANVLDAKVAFVSIALFNILRNPLNLLPNMITNMVQALVSIQRINRLLNSEELNFESISHDYLQSAQLIIRDGTFSWGDEPVLRNINFSCEKSSLSAIVGSVGSGKSSLISSFLGETYKVSGYVNVFGTIAYVPQQAWIQNASLRDNILFGKPYDRMKYQRIIRACALKSDFEMLPAGDSTEIGEKGINLSGGQKQRISLARAVYSNADVYMFDDPLSAVDTHVGKHIFEKVLGPNGLLKSKTRILVTHAITYLPYVNNIIVMKNGEISERGSYQELLDKKGDFSEFLINHTSDDSNEFSTVTLQRTISEFQDSLQHSSITSHDKFQMSQFSLKNMKLIEIEKAETGSVDWNVYKFYLKSVGIFLTMATIILNMFSHGLSIGSNFWLTVWSTDTSIVVNGTTNHSKTTFYLGVYSALGLAKAITSIFAVLAPQLGGCYAAIKLHKLLLHRICHAPMSFFDVTPLGRILSRFSKDISVLDNKLPNFLFQGVNLVFAVIATLCVISYTAPIFIVLIIPVGILYYLIQKFYVATSRQLKRLQAISRSPIYSYFGESITGAQSIRAFKSQARFLNEFERRMDVNQACYYLSTVANRWLAIRLEMLGNVVILFAVLFAVTVKHLNAGLLGLSVTYALEITQTLNTLVRITSEIETNIVSVERIKEYGEAPQEASWENTIAQPECTWPDKGVVEFKNYGVRYRPGLDLVLKCANFKINENEKIGIVGRTGAGKSSLTLSLFRILEAAKGEILIDDVNIAYLGLHSLRSRITIIPQDAVLFHGTVRKNLDPFSKHTDQEIWRALEHAYLKAFVEGLPLGLYHTVTEGGENFSVGQRQLICLGRALLRKTKVLILDEATAAIDLDTDDLIQKSIRTEFNNCTVLTIAHRLNTIMDSDRVIVLDKGNIVEFDTPQNLLKLEGIFYSMCRNAGLA